MSEYQDNKTVIVISKPGTVEVDVEASNLPIEEGLESVLTTWRPEVADGIRKLIQEFHGHQFDDYDITVVTTKIPKEGEKND